MQVVLASQVIKDAAMAHRVSCLVAAASPADRFLVVCGVGKLPLVVVCGVGKLPLVVVCGVGKLPLVVVCGVGKLPLVAVCGVGKLPLVVVCGVGKLLPLVVSAMRTACYQVTRLPGYPVGGTWVDVRVSTLTYVHICTHAHMHIAYT